MGKHNTKINIQRHYGGKTEAHPGSISTCYITLKFEIYIVSSYIQPVSRQGLRTIPCNIYKGGRAVHSSRV